MRLKTLFLLAIACLTFSWVQAQTYTPNNGRIYVNSNAAGTGIGYNWANAATSLADVLKDINENSASYNPAVTEIWVAKGTYVPLYDANLATTSTYGHATFVLPFEVNLYGGFSGDNDSETIANRNQAANPTILNGNDESFSILRVTGGSIVDGFTFTDGIYSYDFNYHGFIKFIAANGSTSILRNCRIVDINNYAYVYNAGTNIEIENSLLIQTSSSYTSYPFYTPSPSSVESSTTITNSTVISKDNIMYILTANNAANTARITLRNSIFYTSSDVSAFSFSSNTNSGVEITAYNSYVKGLDLSLSSIPLSTAVNMNSYNGINALNPNYSNPYLKTDYTPEAFSPLINKGNNTYAITMDYDLAGNSRIYNGTPAIDYVDIGAFEYQGETSTEYSMQLQIPSGKTQDEMMNQKISYNTPIENLEFVLTGYTAATSTDLPAGLTLTETSSGVYTLQGISTVGCGIHPFSITSSGGTPDEGKNAVVYEGTLTILGNPDASGILYVNQNVASEGNGSSWNNAIKELSAALLTASNNNTVTAVWMASGTYLPKYNSDLLLEYEYMPNLTFTLPDGVSIYGGFTGATSETSLEDRNWNVNPTILSGAVGNGDENKNSTRLVYVKGNSTIDGVIMKHIYPYSGNSNSQNIIYAYNSSGSAGYTLNIQNTNINSESLAVYASNFNVFIDNSLIVGAGSYILNFSNSASNTTMNLSINNSTMASTNTVSSSPGILYISKSNYTTRIINVDLNNSILHTLKTSGSTIYSSAYTGINFTSKNSYASGIDLSASTTSIATNVTMNNTGGINATTDENINPYFAPDYSLYAYSPLLNKGDDALSTSTYDLSHNPRKYGTVDLGAFEFQDAPTSMHEFELQLGSGETEEQYLTQIIAKEASITPLVFTIGGTATNATLSGDFPDGISGTKTGTNEYTVSGTLNSSVEYGSYTFRVTSTGTVPNADPSAITYTVTIVVLPANQGNGIVYVDKNVATEGDGSSWDHAVKELSTALLMSHYYSSSVTDIYVAAGTYYPKHDINNLTPGEARESLFLTNRNMYGGFDPANGITDLTHKRDNSLTILSGDISVPDDYTDNTYRILLATNTDQEITVDGFTITGSYYDNNAVSRDKNSTDVLSEETNDFIELFSYNSALLSAGVIVISSDHNITFSNNKVTGNKVETNDRRGSYSYYTCGGGIYTQTKGNSKIYIQGNSVTDNSMIGDYLTGGGIYALAKGVSSDDIIYIEDNYISGNKLTGEYTGYGGGIEANMYNYGVMQISRNTIENNEIIIHTSTDESYTSGGGIDMYVHNYDTSELPIIMVSYNKVNNNHVYLSGEGNGAAYGGGICLRNYIRPAVRAGKLEADKTEIGYSGEIGIINNLVAGNSAEATYEHSSAYAGGIYVNMTRISPDKISIYIANNTIADNTLKAYSDELIFGAGLVYNDTNDHPSYAHYGHIYNNIIWNNTFDYDHEALGIYTSNIYDLAYSTKDGTNNVNLSPKNNLSGKSYLHGNSISDFVLDATNSAGTETSNNPLFRKTSNTDASLNDYRILYKSPAANLGSNDLYVAAGGDLNNNSDLYGEARLFGTAIAAGAYEELCPPILVWLGKSGDWKDADNWYPAYTPEECTDVYIPGIKVIESQSSYLFPTLDETNNNECDHIFFMPGAQLGQPQLLTYNEAHVELNYGSGSLTEQATLDYEALVAKGKENITSKDRIQFGTKYTNESLSRNRWNMLSASLGNIVTGDFAFGGFPFSYIKQFDADGSSSTYIKGTWADFAANSDNEFKPGQGFGHFYYPYMANTPYGMDNSKDNTQWEAAKAYSQLTAPTPTHIKGSGTEFGLAQSNGMLHFPYFADQYLSDARRSHRYSGTETDGTSTFNNFTQSPLLNPEFLQWTGEEEKVTRTAAAYRFITEGWDGKYNAGSFNEGDIVLVGNPYMSALDFDEFYKENSSKIKKVFHIYQKTNTYVIYGGDEANTTDKFIAPMQSFLIEVATDATDLSLTFTPETMATTNTDTKLLTDQKMIADRLTITARNEHGEIKAWVRQLQDASDDFCYYDFSKLIDNPGNLPEVYTLVNLDNGQPRALLMNSIQSNDVVIPVGIASTYKGNISLTISGMDNYNAKVFLIDAIENTETEITDQAEFTLTFDYQSNNNVSALESRFNLRFAPKSPTGIENGNVEEKVKAFPSGNDLIVTSSAMNPVQSVAMYDLQGRRLLQKDVEKTAFCKIENILLHPGVYIVKIQTEQGVKEIKIIR